MAQKVIKLEENIKGNQEVLWNAFKPITKWEKEGLVI